MEHIEVELKFQLRTDPAAARATLARRGATAAAPARQIDRYYNAPDRDFLAAKPVVSEWLRVRTQDNGPASLNFKIWHPIDQARKTHADEYESTIGSPQAVQLLLAALGYTEIGVVDKTREAWHLDCAEVAIDTVANLGSFIEFEYKGTAPDIATATTELEQLIAGLGLDLGDRVHAGYPHLVLGIASA